MNTTKAVVASVVVPERRPMFTRDWDISKHLADWLASREVSPNTISLAGMGASIVAGLALGLTGQGDWVRGGFLVAVLAIVVRGMANVLDGMVAVQRGTASPLGELFNEVPDRISDVAILVGAGYAMGSWVVLGYTAAIAALLTAYVRAQGKAIGTPHEYCGPMAKPQRMLSVAVGAFLCAAIPAEFQPGFEVFHAPIGLMGLALLLITVGGVWTSWRRLRRIAARASKSYSSSL